jgi:transcriptional regulatory protein LevR
MGAELKREFTTEEYQTIEKHLKKRLKYRVIKEIQIKMTQRFLLTPVRRSKIKNLNDSTCW